MRKLFLLAALLLASTAAQAGETYNFDVGGRKIHIDPDRGIVSIPGVYESGPKRAKRSRDNSDDDAPARTTPSESRVDERSPAVQQASPSTSTASSPASAPTFQPSSASANSTPAASRPSEPENIFRSRNQQDAAPSARPAPPVVATAPVEAPVRESSSAATTPLGVWLTEEKEGKVRIEQCGANLCGYSVDKKSNQNGEQVLINMKPAKDAKWSGRILDPNTGSTYDSTIALKGSDSLRVQGCAFGGVFCGGQTWTRVN